MTPRTRKPTAHTDPLAYANRPLEKGFDEYLAVREHVLRHVATVKGREKAA